MDLQVAVASFSISTSFAAFSTESWDTSRFRALPEKPEGLKLDVKRRIQIGRAHV